MFGKSASSEYKEPELAMGLDLGTSKISVIVAEKEEGLSEPQIIAVDAGISEGIIKGNIVNSELTAKAIKQVVSTAENIVGQALKKATVSFSCGDDMSCVTTRGKLILGVNQRPVLEEDVERVIQLSKADLAVPSNKTIIHSMPVKYGLDDNDLENPVGITGKVLTVELVTVMIPSDVVQNVTNCVRKAGLQIEELILKPLASSLAVVTREEAQNGAAVLDMGGGTTSIAVYWNGHPIYFGTIPIGGDHITNDLSTVLKIPLPNAEDLKRRVALCDNETENVQFICNGRTYELPYDDVADIIVCRIEELCQEFIKPKISETGIPALSGGIILTGGVSKTVGIDMLLRDLFNLPVRIAYPEKSSAMPRDKSGQEFSNAAGIVEYIADKRNNRYKYINEQPETAAEQKNADSHTLDIKDKMPWNGKDKVLKEDLKKGTQKISDTVKGLLKDLF